MKYLQPRFTLPASQNTSQFNWDLAFLTKQEFVKKYSRTEYLLAQMTDGELEAVVWKK